MCIAKSLLSRGFRIGVGFRRALAVGRRRAPRDRHARGYIFRAALNVLVVFARVDQILNCQLRRKCSFRVGALRREVLGRCGLR
jgi:hypothetical protein